MDVHVDQARQDGLARQVDMADVAAPAHGARVGNAGDATIGDEDSRMIDRLAGQHIDHMVRGDDHLLGQCGRGGQRQQDGGGDGRCPDSLQHAM